MSSKERLRSSSLNEGETRLVACKYSQRGCNVKLTMEKMRLHKRTCSFGTTQIGDTSNRRDSPQNNVKCPFESIGCDFIGTNRELTEHEKTSWQCHSKFLLIFCLKSDLKALEAHTKLESVSSDLRHKIQQHIISLRISQDERQEDHRMLTSLMEQIIDVKRNLEENEQRFHARFVAIEDNLRLKDEQLAELHRQLRVKSDSDAVIRFRVGMLEDILFEQPSRMCTCALPMQMTTYRIQDGMQGIGGNVMEIREFATKKMQAMTNRHSALISDPFITPNCLTIQLKVFINGEEVQGENCMTVYVVIVRGLNDENLNWPFRGKFTLYIFDPESSNYQFVDSFDADPGHFSFQKPLTDRNIGYGFLRSIRHSELGRLVKDDKLVIQVTAMAV